MIYMAIIGTVFVHNAFIVWHQTGMSFSVQELNWELNKVSISQSIKNVLLYVFLGSCFRINIIEICSFYVKYCSV